MGAPGCVTVPGPARAVVCNVAYLCVLDAFGEAGGESLTASPAVAATATTRAVRSGPFRYA